MTPEPSRARSFGSVGAAYDDARPGYPGEAVELALDGAGPRVLDLGAGTGKLTRALLARGCDVVAVDPDPGMLAVLRARSPGADARAGSAERIPLPDHDVDAVLVGQALHWFDPERAAPEIARVLRPGGMLGALWNGADGEVGWVAALDEARTGSQAPPDNPTGGGAGLELPAAPWFGPPEEFRVRWSRPLTTEGYLADQRTHSWALVSGDTEREAALDRIRARLATAPRTASGAFDLPVRTIVRRTRRR